MNALPPKWSSATLDDVALWGSGGTPSRRNPDFFSGDIPWIKTGELGSKYVRTAEEYISQAAIEASSAKIFPKGSVGIAMYGATIGKASIWAMEAATNQACAVAQCYPGVFNEYLYYFLTSQQNGFVEAGKGGAQPNISQAILKDWFIPLPPTNEQRRIVAKIEEMFSELDKGIEALTTAREQLKAYRMALLHKCVCDEDGKFYPLRPLDDLIGPIEQGWSPTCDLNRPADEDEWAIIKTTVVQPMSYLAKECKPFPAGLTPRPDIEIHDGDILMTRKGPRVRTGVVCYVKKARPRSMLCDTVYRFRAKEGLVDPEYLELALNSPHVVREIDSKKAGISESGISLNHSRVRSVRIPVVASKDQQRSIVALLKKNLDYVERTDAVVENEILRIGALRQSILKQAFSGQLVSQDASDEAASILLARIKAEQLAKGGNSRRRVIYKSPGKRKHTA